MKTRLSLIASALLMIGLTQAESAYAVQGSLTTAITRTLVTVPQTYGGCMAKLAAALSTAVPAVNCPGNFVSFSCNGTYVSKDLAFYMLDQAQLALSLNKQVFVVVDDTKKHNGNCFAQRIDVLK
jgi:hypothetical protein